jgi:hypothetical protein
LSLLTTLKNKKKFSPRDIPGLRLFIDASDYNTVDESSGSVSEIRDKSGKANHATQTTGVNQPVTNSVTINSRNALDFNGTSHYMLLPAFMDCSSAATVFIVGKYDQLNTGTSQIMFSTKRSLTNDKFWIYNSSGATNFTFTLGNNSTLIAGDTSAHVFTNSSAGGTSSVLGESYLDGGSKTKTTSTVEASLEAWYIGSKETSFFCDCNVAEIIVYNRKLSDDERSLVESYLGRKWGITMS